MPYSTKQQASLRNLKKAQEVWKSMSHKDRVMAHAFRNTRTMTAQQIIDSIPDSHINVRHDIDVIRNSNRRVDMERGRKRSGRSNARRNGMGRRSNSDRDR